MQRLAISILFSTLALAQTEDTHRVATAKLGVEADKFASAAPKYVARETLQQMRYDDKKLARGPRPGQPWPPIIKREVISEYAYAAVGTQLREMRQVISVDGKAARTDDSALQALALGVTSTDEAMQRKMLEDFEKHGLRGVATDFAQSILLFATGNPQKYEIQYKATQNLTAVQFLTSTSFPPPLPNGIPLS